MNQIGDRVGAILGAKNGEIRFLGYGKYVGNEIPPPGVCCLGIDLHGAGISNPRIDLDDGDTVWGCQCWWGPEEKIKKQIDGQNVVMVRMADALKEVANG